MKHLGKTNIRRERLIPKETELSPWRRKLHLRNTHRELIRAVCSLTGKELEAVISILMT